jgi:hypothetical protein
LWVVIVLISIMLLTILLQTTTAVTDSLSSAGNAAPKQGINVLSMLMKGGPIMIPIAICSLIAVYIMIERYFNIRQKFKINPHFMSGIKENVVNGNITAALTLCRTNPTPVARMVEKGLMRIGKPLKVFFNLGVTPRKCGVRPSAISPHSATLHCGLTASVLNAAPRKNKKPRVIMGCPDF